MTSAPSHQKTFRSGGDARCNFDSFEAWYPVFALEDLSRFFQD